MITLYHLVFECKCQFLNIKFIHILFFGHNWTAALKKKQEKKKLNSCKLF